MVELLPNGRVRFTFVRPTDQDVFLVGDFNDWNELSHSMIRVGDHGHALELQIAPGEYEYKFKVGRIWYNDYEAPKYVPNPWGSENSVVMVPEPAPIAAEARAQTRPAK